MRIVYDAFARVSSDAISLNDCLHPGPSLLQDLCGLLLKFRVPQVAMIADIKKAFLQVELCEVDRDATFFESKSSFRSFLFSLSSRRYFEASLGAAKE